MRTRLVSFLGLGSPKGPPPYYTPTAYSLDGRISESTPLLDVALCELIPDIGSACLLGTEAVRKRWIDSGLALKLGLDRLADHLHFEEVPTGETPQQRWRLFEQVVLAMRPEKRDDLRETEPPEQLIVDVTHGYRSHPLLGVAAVSFAISEWARLGIEKPPALRVVYGAFEAKVDDAAPAPVWDLTELVTAGRWNGALDALMRYGRADELAALAKIESSQAVAAAQERGLKREELAQYSFPKLLGERAKAFADALTLMRLRDLVTTAAPQLLKTLNSPDADALVTRIPPLKGTIEQLRRELGALRADSLMSPEGLRSMAALARLCLKTQRYSELAITIRESLISEYGLFLGHDAVEPGQPQFYAHRDATESQWGSFGAAVQGRQRLAKAGKRLPPLSSRQRLAAQIVKPRNDLEHGGLSNDPMPASNLRNSLEGLERDFREFLASDSAVGHSPARAFLNLSNHPIADWTAAQLAASQALGLGEPADLDGGMPLVPSDATTDAVVELADELVARALSQSAAGAFVAGEFTLVAALVPRLQAAGIRCFTATRERDGEPRPAAEAASTPEYGFVRWREYPPISAVATGGREAPGSS